MNKVLLVLLALLQSGCLTPDEEVGKKTAKLSSDWMVVRLKTTLDLPPNTFASIQIVSPDKTNGQLNSIAVEEFSHKSGLFTMDWVPNQYRNICAGYQHSLAPMVYGLILDNDTREVVGEIDGSKLELSLARIVDGEGVETHLPTEPLPDTLRQKLPWKMSQQAIIISGLAEFCQ